MNTFEKIQPLIIVCAIGLGLLVGQLDFLAMHAESFILPFLLLMLYGLFLSIPLKNFQNAFKNIPFLSTSTILNFVWTPLLAWGLGAIFLADHPALWLGFILLLVTPCTDWYLIFTSIAKGNMPLSASVLPVNLLLQVILLPVYLYMFAGKMQTIGLSTLFESVVLVLLFPFLLAVLTRYLFKKNPTFLKAKLIPFFSASQLIFLSLAIVAMFAAQGAYLVDNLHVIGLMIIPLLLFFVVNFIVAQTVGKTLNFTYEETTSLNLTIIARNSPIALSIVVTAFPDQPLIALALIIGPLIELPVLAILSQILLRLRQEGNS
ncbi:arsenic resistance protein [Oceanobacillus kapialis]|uniref:arsenic resistance protein n=1 Tax=Oceanobacillus kapialis TaxID=481353 RepID=UPI0038517740